MTINNKKIKPKTTDYKQNLPPSTESETQDEES